MPAIKETAEAYMPNVSNRGERGYKRNWSRCRGHFEVK